MVPVDNPAIGMSAHSRTTARWVPSPPSTTIARTPAARIRRAAVKVSFTVVVGSMSRNSSSGKAWCISCSRLRLRVSMARMPPLSGIIRTFFTPIAPAALITRITMLTRSVICRLPAFAMMRRISRADTGFAMMPMQGAELAPGADMRESPDFVMRLSAQAACHAGDAVANRAAGRADAGFAPRQCDRAQSLRRRSETGVTGSMRQPSRRRIGRARRLRISSFGSARRRPARSRVRR